MARATRVGVAVAAVAVVAALVAPSRAQDGASASAPSRARGRAEAIALDARLTVARAFAALDPARKAAPLFARALDGTASGVSLASAFDGRCIELRHDAGAWSFREAIEGAPWRVADKLPLAAAIEAAGPWGRVVLPKDAPPVEGASLGRASWNSAAVGHAGPVLIQGGRVKGVASQGAGAPALWFDGCEILATSGAKAAVEIHAGVALGTPLAFTDCTFGAEDPSARRWGDFPMQWGVRAYPQGPLAFVRCRFAEDTSEHSIYASNVQGALWIDACEFEPSPRTNVQVTNRVREGPPGTGPIAIRGSQLAISRKAHGGAGGGGSVTVAGHHGPVALLDLDFTTGKARHAWDSHNALIVVWGEPTPGTNGGAHLLPDGYWMPEVALAGIRLAGEPADGPYVPDREAVMLSAVREVWIEAPAPTRVPVRGFGGSDPRAGRILVNAHDPSGVEGQRVVIGAMHWDASAARGTPWWHVVGRDWAQSLPPHPKPGDYGAGD